MYIHYPWCIVKFYTGPDFKKRGVHGVMRTILKCFFLIPELVEATSRPVDYFILEIWQNEGQIIDSVIYNNKHFPMQIIWMQDVKKLM